MEGYMYCDTSLVIHKHARVILPLCESHYDLITISHGATVLKNLMGASSEPYNGHVSLLLAHIFRLDILDVVCT